MHDAAPVGPDVSVEQVVVTQLGAVAATGVQEETAAFRLLFVVQVVASQLLAPVAGEAEHIWTGTPVVTTGLQVTVV